MRSSRRWPKLHWTSAPTVYPPSRSVSFRLAVPIPPLKPRQIIPVPPPTFPSATGPGFALSRARKVCCLGHVKPIDVAEVAVPGLRHDRKAAVEVVGETGAPPLDHCVPHGADAVGVGDRDRIHEQAVIFDPGGAGHLSVAVEIEPAGEDRGEVVAPAGEDRGDAGPHGAFADLELPRSADDGLVPHGHAGDVGDGVQRAGRALERDAEVSGSTRGLGGQGNHQTEREHESGGRVTGTPEHEVRRLPPAPHRYHAKV